MYVYDTCLFLCLCEGLWECLLLAAVVEDSVF